MSARVVARCIDCGWTAEVADELLVADLEHECIPWLYGVDLSTTPACEAPDCEANPTWAGRSRCVVAGSHAWQLVCDDHRAAADRKWSRTRIAWCVEHEQPVGSPALEWRPL